MLSQNALVKIQRHISIWQCTCTAEARSVRSDIYLRSTRLHSLSIHKGSSDTFKLAPSVSIRNKTTTRLENLMLMVQKRCSSTRGAQPKSSVTLGVDQKMDRPNLLPRRKHISLLLSYIWPKEHPEIRARVTFALFLMVTTKVVTVVVPFFFKAIVDSFDPATAITVFNPLALSLPSLAISYGLIRIFKHTIEQLRYAIYNDVAQKAIDQVSILVFRTLHQADAEYHVMRQTGGLSRQIERGLKGLNSVLTIFLFHLVPTVLEMALVCSVLQVTLGVTYSVTTFISVLAYCTFTLVTTAWRTKFRVQMNALNTKSSNVMVDSLLNFESVRLNNNEYFEEQRYKNILDEHFERVSRVTWSLAFLNFGQGFIMSTAVALNTWMAIDGVSSGALTIGDLVMMHSLMFQLSVPLNFFGSMYREITQASIDMQALFNIVESRRTLDNRATREFNFQRGKIEFRNVSFNYSNCAVDTSLTLPPGSLRDISLVIEPGQFIGLVGPTGSGKSTLLRLLCKLYTPSGGCILIDDQDITTVTPRSLRQHISVVTQDLSLFNESFRYNIAYGYPEATNDEIIQAAKMASIHDGIIKTEKGYDTIVGERGLRLSGGERQRVMIARALLRKSSILLADEATSALDNNTEAHVMKYLTKNKTSILVAHRLTSVIRAAQIVVVDQGRIRELGTHEELLRNRDLYWAMWQKQQNKSLESVPLP